MWSVKPNTFNLGTKSLTNTLEEPKKCYSKTPFYLV